jgi:hypothetical protein
MKRNFLTAMFLSVAMLGGMVAQASAADITFGGQLRPRFEVFEQNDFSDASGETYIMSTRIRLNVNAKINDKTSAFIQMQARGVYGSSTPVPAPLNGGNVGNRSSGVPSDAVTDVGLHQAYFTLQDFFNLPVDFKVGRQEIVLDGHRLFGNTGWTQGAQTHDALRLTHHHGEHTLSYMFISATESTGAFGTTIGANTGGAALGQSGFGGLFGTGSGACAGAGDECDRNEHVFWGNIKGILGGALSLYFVITDDDSFNVPNAMTEAGVSGLEIPTGSVTTAGIPADNDIYTIGFRQAGQLFGLDYRAEFYYQTGDAEGVSGAANTAVTVNGFDNNTFSNLATLGTANPNGTVLGGRVATRAGTATGLTGAGSNVDRDAYMFGLRLGKTFSNVMWKPSATIWYDHISGTDLEDVASGDWNTFDTLYDTGHKFYGFMDTYLNPNGADTSWRGLRDLAGKFKIHPMANLTFKADIHAMWTDTSIEDDLNDLGFADATAVGAITTGLGGFASNQNRTVTVGDLDSHLGEELDLTLVYKYNPNTTLSIGYSHFWADDSFHALNGRLTGAGVGNPTGTSSNKLGSGNADNASWAYVQMDVKF